MKYAAIVGIVLAHTLSANVLADSSNREVNAPSVDSDVQQTSSRRIKDLNETNTTSASPIETRAQAPSPIKTRPAKSSSRDLLVQRTLLAVGLALAAVAALFVTLGKRRQQGRGGSNEELTLLSTLTIAPRCSLLLVRANGQPVLIARDTSGVRTMVPLSDSFADYLKEGGASSEMLTPHRS